MTRTFVGPLFGISSPATILWAIRPVIISAFNRMQSRWSFAHVCKEHSKRFSPSLANSNASTAVVNKVLSGVIFTPSNHVFPDGIFGALGSTVAHVSSATHLCPQASATSAKASREVGTELDGNCSAVALAAPEHGVIDTFASLFEDKQSVETLAKQVNLRGHLEPILSGVAPRAVSSSAEAFSCLHFNAN